MVTSKGTVKVHPTWDLGYKGDGKVVAIIDTCMDPSHKDMRLSNAENVKIKQTDIERMTEALNLPGNWISDKVPYGYNYADNNSDILSTHPH
jgi:lactocepin